MIIDYIIKILIIIMFLIGNWLVFGRSISLSIKETLNHKKVIKSIRRNKSKKQYD